MRDELKRREALRHADPATRMLAGMEGQKVAMTFAPADGSPPVSFQGTMGEVEIPEADSPPDIRERS